MNTNFEHYISCGGKRLRCGYTTGTCAALAASAATRMLLSQRMVDTATMLTPKGIWVTAEILDASIMQNSASCAVKKDAGDDSDVTDGILIYAKVCKTTSPTIQIDGGEGIGRVTRKGLEQPIGAAAINRVPRELILREVEKVCEEFGCDTGISVVISAPKGAKIASKTFNPRLGIEGGISILGTSGIVEPQSVQALVDSIETEFKMLAANGEKNIIVALGNYGEDFLSKQPKLSNRPTIKCSNYIGEALDFAAIWGFESVLLVGHIGKLCKLAGGIMNTHSKIADCRAEIFTAHAALAGASLETLNKLANSITSDECIEILDTACLREKVIQSLLVKMQAQMSRRAASKYTVGAVLFSNEYGLLGMTSGATLILEGIT